MNQPPITVTETDYDRIDALLDETGETVPGIRELRAELDRANVVASDKISANVVTMNSTITFENIDSGKHFEMALVYPKDIDGRPDKVSILAPVGSALLGLAVDQVIQWQVPGGDTLELRVLDVQNQPEARYR